MASPEDADGAAAAEKEVIDDDDSVEEKECRVCRCPAESGRPLRSPCKCSGSIQLCHEDCLNQWLRHSNKDRCEVCSHKFEFKAVYAENTPVHLPLSRVILTIFNRILTEYLPFAGRVILAIFLWLFFVPLQTSMFYRIWIHRSRVFMERMTLAYVTSLSLRLPFSFEVYILSCVSDSQYVLPGRYCVFFFFQMPVERLHLGADYCSSDYFEFPFAHVLCGLPTLPLGHSRI